MGVPKFYRWVSERYPLINQRIGTETEFLPIFDNMYLDMNGIIHTCTHPGDEQVTDKISLKDMVLGMFTYVDRMVQIVKPQGVLVLAVDGCAPRAKMNQQRSRRFRAAKDRREALTEALSNGDITEAEAKEQFDSNCITPGTDFMDQVSENFKYFVRKKIKEDPLWQKLRIVYSGHDVPGEGEHKIMDFIRHERMQPGYNPNTRHCLCGLDADLIMLGLASHEPHFALLREVVDFQSFSKRNSSRKEVKKQIAQDKWQLLHLCSLRQYLDIEFRVMEATLPFAYDLERVIDDWVLMVMLVGNDFLPHLPSLDIGEGALDNMAALYRELLPVMGGYLTQDGNIHFDRLELLLRKLGESEDTVFRKRAVEQKKQDRRGRRGGGAPIPPPPPPANSPEEAAAQQAELDEAIEAAAAAGVPAHKHKYYREKFGVDLVKNAVEAEEIVNTLKCSYIQGLQWCFRYYYQGVQSWTWFFPFHYAPMASDLTDLSAVDVDLSQGRPFVPYMQLLSCLPADSSWCLPACYRQLMTEPSSPIADFYPATFEVDMNGKRNPWEGVNLLPFIDERRLREAVANHCPDESLTPKELKRNTPGVELEFNYDPSNTVNVRSPFPEAGLLDIVCCQTSVERYTLPPMERFDPNLLPGTVANAPYPGDPQLLCLDIDVHKSKLRPLQLNIFGFESKKDTMTLRLTAEAMAPPPGGGDRLDNAIHQLGHVPPRTNLQTGPTVWVNYPHLHEAVVVSVATVGQIARAHPSFLQDHAHTAKAPFWRFPKHAANISMKEHSKSFRRDAMLAQTRVLRGAGVVATGGLDIGEVHVMLLVRPLFTMHTNPVDGSSVQIFGDEETWVPFQLVALSNPAPDARFIPTGKLALEERFPVDSQVMCLGKIGYGQVGTVVSVDAATNEVHSRFSAVSPQLPPFGATIARTIMDKFMSSHRAAKQLSIATTTLGKIMGSLRVCPGRHDIGLNLRMRKEYMVPAYTRCKAPSSSGSGAAPTAWTNARNSLVIHGLEQASKEGENGDADDNGAAATAAAGAWEYTTRALDLVLTYKKKFPAVFRAVQSKPNEREYSLQDLFGRGISPEKAEEELAKVKKWLAQLETHAMHLVPVSSKYMSPDAVKAVEKTSSGIVKQMTKQRNAAKHKYVIVKLPAEMMFRCKNDSFELPESPTCRVLPALGDRVENLINPMVPFGMFGTVVATHAISGCVEVVFDEEFVGGGTLNGLCSPGRGKLLPWSQLLSLSRKVPMKPARAGGANSRSRVLDHKHVKPPPRSIEAVSVADKDVHVTPQQVPIPAPLLQNQAKPGFNVSPIVQRPITSNAGLAVPPPPSQALLQPPPPFQTPDAKSKKKRDIPPASAHVKPQANEEAEEPSIGLPSQQAYTGSDDLAKFWEDLVGSPAPATVQSSAGATPGGSRVAQRQSEALGAQLMAMALSMDDAPLASTSAVAVAKVEKPKPKANVNSKTKQRAVVPAPTISSKVEKTKSKKSKKTTNKSSSGVVTAPQEDRKHLSSLLTSAFAGAPSAITASPVATDNAKSALKVTNVLQRPPPPTNAATAQAPAAASVPMPMAIPAQQHQTQPPSQFVPQHPQQNQQQQMMMPPPPVMGWTPPSHPQYQQQQCEQYPQYMGPPQPQPTPPQDPNLSKLDSLFQRAAKTAGVAKANVDVAPPKL